MRGASLFFKKSLYILAKSLMYVRLDHIIKDSHMVMASVTGANHLPTQLISLWDRACSQTWRNLDCTLGHLGTWLPPSAFLETKEEKASADCSLGTSPTVAKQHSTENKLPNDVRFGKKLHLEYHSWLVVNS